MGQSATATKASQTKPATATKTPKLTDAEKATRRAKRDSERRAAFLRLVDKRVNAALDRIEFVGRLGRTNSYASSPEEREKILAALANAVREVQAQFSAGAKDKGEKKFAL